MRRWRSGFLATLIEKKRHDSFYDIEECGIFQAKLVQRVAVQCITQINQPRSAQVGGVFVCIHVPQSAPKPCTHPGCGVLVRDGSGRCAKHARPAWTKAKPVPRVTGRKLQALRLALYRRDPCCAECRGLFRLDQLERDHAVPLAEGGTDDESNTRLLCGKCHDAKSAAESLRGRGRSNV